jgi:hypothetical protein
MRRGFSIAAIAVLALVVSGCGGASQKASSSDPTKDQAQAAPISQAWDAHIRAWKQELLAAANEDKDVRFPTPSQAAFEEKLAAAAASQFDFRVLSVEFVPAPQGSPLVIVESASPRRFSQDAPAIVRLLDPQTGGEDWQGWDYEGFLGAQDQQDEPFLTVFNFERAHGGGQWARSEDLYPFEHG